MKIGQLKKTKMNFIETGFEGLWVIEPKVWVDDRGYFFESYNEDLFKKHGMDVNFKQDNQSFSQKGAVRGLHFQMDPFAQGKLVRVIKGAVKDVVVDIRKNSKTFGKHFDLKLTEENFLMLWVPPGFAHGFSTLANNTIFSYKCSNVYNKESEGGILFNDPSLNIDWEVDNPILSPKDLVLPSFADFKSPF